MDKATYQVAPGFVWPTLGHPGRVPLWALVPTPKQPRQYFDKDELQALAETMNPEKKGQQREILAVRDLAKEELKLYKPARYMVKSGERRWRAAALAGCTDIEIRVKEYESVAEEKLDTFMLNEGRVGLSDIENAEAIADIMQEFKLETQEQLALKIGKDQFWVSQHLALLKLSPKVRALMSPEVPEYARLKRNVGVFLSRLTSEVQDDFAARMPHGREATATQQVRWMQEELKKTGEQLPTRLRKPSTIRQILGYFADQTARRSKQILDFENFDQLFTNATSDQVFWLLGEIKDAQAELGDLVTQIEELSKAFDPKPAVVPAAKPSLNSVDALVRKHNTSVVKTNTPAVSSEPIVKQVHEHGKRLLGMQAGNGAAGASRPDPVPSSPKSLSPSSGKMAGEKTITYMGENGRKVTDKVTQQRYIQLWDDNNLGFQVDKKDRPAWMPTREAAVEDWPKFCD